MSDDSTLFDLQPESRSDDGRDPRAEDAGLADVVEWFRGQPDLQEHFGAILRQSLDEVLDGQRTGRYDIDGLEKTEKTYLGTKVEIVIRAAFDLPRGERMDFRVAGHDIDSKFSIRGSWSIPTEAMGHLCLLTSANDRKGIFDVGVIRITPDILNEGRNKDQKTTITAAAKARIVWLAHQGRLPGNLLLSLSDALVTKIMSSRSGQQRINELLRQVQGTVIERNTAVTVARQADGLKRCRDARRLLAPEGIVVLGHQKQSPVVAAALRLPVPAKGTFVSVRLVRVDPSTDDRPNVHLPEGVYAAARADDPVEPAPQIDC